MTQSIIVFTDRKAKQAKMYDPAKDSVKVLLGFGQEERVDGTKDTCSFTQVQGSCSLGKVLFVSDVATGAMKLVTSLAGTVSFLKSPGCLYDSFGIHCRGEASEGCTLEKAKTNDAAIIKCVKSIVDKVKQRY